MDKIKSLVVALFNWFTSKNTGHNRALSDLLHLSRDIEDFLSKYRLLEDSSAFKIVFENIGQVRIDATEMVYQAEIRIRGAKLIKSKDLTPMVEEVYNNLDELKRSLFTRTLSNNVLAQRVTKLNMSFENMLAAISNIAYK